jgi:Carboxypeptidase regulatory-like domain
MSRTIGAEWACAAACVCLWAAPCGAAVRIVRGPTPMMGGQARSAGDLTVINEKLAFGLAVESPAPYGVPRGALVDLAPVAGGHVGRNRVVFADFIPNNWSAWPNTYQHVTVIEETPDEVVIEADRDWGGVKLVTVYSLKSGSDQIHVVVTMTNGGAAPLTNLRSGVTLWPNSGFLFAVPGLAGVEDGAATGALADRVVAYDADWTVALHAPYLDHVGYGSKDMYQTHSLAPGESRTFEAWLQVGASGDLAPVVAEEIARKHLPSGVVSGAVSDASGAAVAQPVIVISKDGQPYAWTLGQGGHFSIALPAGDYTAYATAKGYSETEPRDLHVAAGGAVVQDFAGLRPPGELTFHVARKDTGAPLDARITIEAGQKPLVEFLGRRTFFTELDRKGTAEAALAPGDYVFKASYAAGVLAAPAEIRASVASGQSQTADAAINVLFDPRAWAGPRPTCTTTLTRPRR